MEGCYSCTQKYIEENARRISIRDEAKILANKTGEWVGIYKDEQGKDQIAVFGTGQYYFYEHISADMQHS